MLCSSKPVYAMVTTDAKASKTSATRTTATERRAKPTHATSKKHASKKHAAKAQAPAATYDNEGFRSSDATRSMRPTSASKQTMPAPSAVNPAASPGASSRLYASGRRTILQGEPVRPGMRCTVREAGDSKLSAAETRQAPAPAPPKNK